MPLLRALHRVLDRRVLTLEALTQPVEGRRRVGILIAQPLCQLGGERLRQRFVAAGYHVRLQHAIGAACLENSLAQRIGLLAIASSDSHLIGKTPQVFDEDNAQCDGDRPQLADGERLDALVRVDEAPKRCRIEMAIRVGHERPGDAKDPRITREGASRQFGKLPVISGWQIVPDLANLRFDEVIIVEQPFGGGYDAAPAFEFCGTGAIGLEQYGRVVVEPALEGNDARRTRGHDLRGGKAFGVKFKPLDAEQVFPDRLRIVPQRLWRPAAEDHSVERQS